MLFGEGLQDVGEVGGFGLWRDTLSSGTVTRKTGLEIKRRLGHPVGVVLLNGSSHCPLEPFDVSWLIFSRHLVVDLQSQIGDERRLRSSEVLWKNDRLVRSLPPFRNRSE